MKTSLVRQLPHLSLAVILCLTFLLIALSTHSFASTCAGDGNPCGNPYLKATGGDVGTGGWFNNGWVDCSTAPTSNYQDPNFGTPKDDRYGGILAWAKTTAGGANSAGGSSSEFAAISAGEIAGDSTANEGFYTWGTQANASSGNTPKSSLSFANIASPPIPTDFWGGLMVPRGSVRQISFCVPDYYGTMMPSPVPGPLPGDSLSDPAVNFGSHANPVYYKETPDPLNPLDLVSSDVTIPADAHIEIFIDGPVYIRHNIIHAGGYLASNVPKFSLIVKGSIYIDPNVTNLDGLYIAQPDPADTTPLTHDTGNIWTCHDGTVNPVSYLYPAVCIYKLVVNGAFIAKQVELLRVNGDVAGANTGDDGFSNAIGSPGVAEVINYSPAMVIGGPVLISGHHSKIDSLISLPPVF